MSKQDNCSYESKFIKNYTENTPTSNKRVLSFTDEYNKPLVFTQGSDDKLYLIFQKDGDPAWSQVNLMEHLGKEDRLTAFDVFQSPDAKSIRMCIGVNDEKNENSLYITDILNVDSFTERFSSETFWVKLKTKKDEIIDHILVDNYGAFITTKKAKQHALFYRIDKINDGIENQLSEFQFSEDMKEIQDIKLGRWSGRSGLFLLYYVGSEQTIFFRGFPDNPKYKDKFFSKRFFHNDEVDSIAIVEKDTSGNHDLYVAGKGGLFCYKSEVDNPIQILEPPKDFSFKNLQISNDNGFLSCWFLDSTNMKILYYMYNAPSSGKWSEPMPLKKNVEQYATIRGKHIRNHLFYIDNKGKLNHFFEDEVSSLWFDNFIPLQGVGTFKESVGYLTEVKFNQTTPFEDDVIRSIRLTSPINIYISVDEALYQIGPENPINLPYDGRASIFISHTLNSGFVDAVLCLKASFLNAPIAIDMAKSIYDRIEKLASNNFDDIKDIVKENGEPLLPAEYKDKDKTLAELAKALNYLVEFRKDCRNDNICGTNLIMRASNQSNQLSEISMTMGITGSALGAAIGGYMGASAFMGAALLIPKDPISEGVLLAGVIICGIIGAIIGGAIGWTLTTTITERLIDDPSEPPEPPKICPRLTFTRVGCRGAMSLYNEECFGITVDLNVNHMFSAINMILTFIGITPEDIPEWPTDNEKCVYYGYLN
jgi:hypothetical protein